MADLKARGSSGDTIIVSPDGNTAAVRQANLQCHVISGNNGSGSHALMAGSSVSSLSCVTICSTLS